MNNLAVELTRAAAVIAALGGSSAEFSSLSDAQILAARAPIAELLRLSYTVPALLGARLRTGPGLSWVSRVWLRGTGSATQP
jgi:hypothetical protein